MPIAKTQRSAQSQARIAQVAEAVKKKDMRLQDVHPAGFRAAVRSMLGTKLENIQTIKREARAKARG